MGRKTLLLAFHNHQPDGNFGAVFEQSYEACYRPTVELLLAYPNVRCGLHFTGALYEWIEQHRPAFFGHLRQLCERDQVEILGGGFYEPMLAVLPERDALGQLRMMSDYVAHHFGKRPRGMWLAERVWEPGLPRLIADAGLEYTMLDDGHFRYAGMEGRLPGYFVTEKAGAATAIFPIDQELRYAIPFHQAHEVIAALERRPDGTYTYGDDGEKFGVWPGTHEWVWDKGWLRTFFGLLSERTDVVCTKTFSEVLDSQPPTGRVYLPAASYEEMGEWALPADAQRRYLELRDALAQKDLLERSRAFLRGGIWQNFLAKYDEAHFMHKKMLLVSEKVARAQAKQGKSQAASPQATAAIDEAVRELYRAQCNCSYWHGLFGGLYLGYLRHVVYAHLIRAEQLVDPVSQTRIVRADYDADRQEEILVEGESLATIIRPAYGGAVCSLDCRDRPVNLQNVLSRREEGYHKKLLEASQATGHHDASPRSIHDLAKVKEEGLERLLVADRHLRLGFVDHFLGNASLDAMAQASYEELGDFVGTPYRVLSVGSDVVELARDGFVAGQAVSVNKRYVLAKRSLQVAYRVEAAASLPVRFAPEFSLFLDTDEHRRAPRADLGSIETLRVHHDWLGLAIVIRFSPAPLLWRFPLEAASQSEDGFERTYQGTVFVPVFETHLGAGARCEAHIEIEIAHA